jgi:hypothetical protein
MGNVMLRNLVQNRLAIEIACDCLKLNGFAKVARNKDQGTFPDTYVTATDTRSGVEYLIGITSRGEVGADGKLNPAYNIVHSAADRRRAKALATHMKRRLAFIAIPLRETNGSYAAFFGELAPPLDFPIEVPMLPQDRLRLGYRQLAPFTPDARVKELFTN